MYGKTSEFIKTITIFNHQQLLEALNSTTIVRSGNTYIFIINFCALQLSRKNSKNAYCIQNYLLKILNLNAD